MDIIYLLITTHITIVTVTVYLHRALAHRSLSVSKPLGHFFRFWCWLTTGQNPKEWAAVHRKHHAFCEKEGDPHSPKLFGIWTVLFKGVILYKKEANNPETIKRYGHLTPDDHLSKFYSKYSKSGMIGLGVLQVALFGWHGLWILLLQLAWIPFWAAGVVNGIGHFKGYRNFNTTDSSTNISPLGLIIGGEELHNNHHAYPTSAKLSFKWYEFDIGWAWIQLFSLFGLVKVNKIHQLPKIENAPVELEESFSAMIQNKAYVLKLFYKKTKNEFVKIISDMKQEHKSLQKVSNKEMQFIYYSDSQVVLSKDQESILDLLLQNKILAYLYSKKQELLKFWTDRNATVQQLKSNFQIWLEENQHSNYQNISESLRNFSYKLSCLKLKK